MPNARDLRLQSDHTNLRSLAAGSGGTLMIESAKGSPPDRYILVFKCRSIERLEKGKPVYRALNRVEIVLPAKYPAPFAAPRVRMLTPIWHPHVYKNLVVCMGDWTTSEYLDHFALRLGALLQFEKEFFDIRDPANEEAIDWARKNLLLFPTDTCTFHGDTVRSEEMPPGYTPLMPTPPTSSVQTFENARITPSEEDEIVWNEL